MNTYSVTEIARVLNITPRAVQKKSQHECWVFEKRRGYGGGKIFPFATLPKDVQAAILAAQAKTEPSAVPALPTNLPTPDPSRLPLAYAKADLVRLYLAWQRKHGATVSQKQAFIDAYLGGAYPQVFAQVGAISWKTLERWKKQQLDAGSAVVLADKRGIAHRGKSSLTKEHIGIILGAVLNPNAPNIHTWCHAVVHWNLPSNPVDLEQREGRVHRYKGHAVRKNIAERYGLTALSVAFEKGDPWQTLFHIAAQRKSNGHSDLIPYWIFEDGSARVERRIPQLPYSKEVGKLKRLKQGLALYRMVFGQPRQEDLLFSLSQNGNHESADLADWLISLQPPETVLKDESAEENTLILPPAKSVQGISN